ncbi:MAG: hypothetical protein NTZ33_15450 [Bacteroidetes bacterium]|nr:hypothetical protein [Bacteroidota bacterium]
METSYFSDSENLYKYFVSIGILLIVLTVYYPLKEKQELEIIKIQLENDVKILNYKINENSKNVKSLQFSIARNGTTKDGKELLKVLSELNNTNHFNQIESEKKFFEIIIRTKNIKLYNIMFWLFFPIGICLTIYGFLKWGKAKKYDDNILKLENEKLELEVNKMRKEIIL